MRACTETSRLIVMHVPDRRACGANARAVVDRPLWAYRMGSNPHNPRRGIEPTFAPVGDLYYTPAKANQPLRACLPPFSEAKSRLCSHFLGPPAELSVTPCSLCLFSR